MSALDEPKNKYRLNGDLKNLMSQLENLHKSIEEQANLKYQPDTSIFFKRGRMQYYQHATIIRISCTRGNVRLFIHNDETNKEYWIDHFFLKPEYQ